MFKIEAGKYYKTRDGRKVGPISKYNYSSNKDFVMAGNNEKTGFESYRLNGTWHHLNDFATENDLISEWQDEEPTGPVRTVTVTKKEIANGVYGIVVVGGSLKNKVFLSIDRPVSGASAQELREAAKVLNELASALEENANV